MAWQVLAQTTQILAVHVALLPPGKVLLLGGDQHDAERNDEGDVGNSRLLDLASLTVRSCASPAFDVFCCGHAGLLDGRLLLAGGTADFPPGDGSNHPAHFPGLRDAATFDPRTEQWTVAASMNPEPGRTTGGGRWYPSLVTLDDGRVLAVSGYPGREDTRDSNDSAEVYSPSPPEAGTWRLASDPDPTHRTTNYPRAHVLPDGTTFFASPVGGRTQRLRHEPYAWTDVTGPVPDPFYGGIVSSSVLLPLLPEDGYRARVLVTNGAQPYLIDLGAPAPAWVPTAPRALAGAPVRQHATAVLLADGRVLVSGGCSVPSDDATAVRPAELYDPWSGTWSVDDPAEITRNYHSVALLLPDGRVLTAGGNGGARQSFPEPGVDTRELRIELYSPSYVSTTRPEIAWAPDAVGWAETFQVRTPATERIHRVALLRAGTATHAWNGDQRFVGCTFERTGDGLLVKAPPTTAIAPPGSYLLVVLDELGTPSAGRFLTLGPPRRGSSSLVQTGSGSRGDFALVAPRAGGGLSTWFRDNDAPEQPWSAGPPVAPDGGAVEAVPSAVQGHADGTLEVAARIGDRLASYRCAGTWDGPVLFGASGVRGNPAMVRGWHGGRGNLELVVPVEGGGMAHYWRNDDAGGVWSEPTVFGESDGVVDAVALVQGDLGDSGDLEVIARYGTALAQWWRESAAPWRWAGPVHFFDGAAGVPSVVRSRFGVRGILELVTPLAGGGAANLSRDEDVAHLPWSDPSGDIAPGQRVVAASLLESSLGDSGRGGTLELVLRTEDGRNHHHWRTDGPPETWQGPTAVLT